MRRKKLVMKVDLSGLSDHDALTAQQAIMEYAGRYARRFVMELREERALQEAAGDWQPPTVRPGPPTEIDRDLALRRTEDLRKAREQSDGPQA